MDQYQLMNRIKFLITKNNYFRQIKNVSDRETIINDTFMNIWQKIDEGKLSDKLEDLDNYIFISTRNNCLCFLRSKQRERKLVDIDDTFNPPSVNPHNDWERKDEIDHIFKFIDKLDMLHIDREILKLRKKGISVREISEMLDMEFDEVNQLYKNLMAFLKRSIKRGKVKPRVIANYNYIVTNVESGEVNIFTKRLDVCKFLHVGERTLLRVLDDGGGIIKGHKVEKRLK